MSPASNVSEHTIRRILVALDASPHSEAALEAAVQVATALDAELRGLFVEDLDLLRTAALPVAHEVHSFAHPPQAMSERRVSRQLAQQAAAARAAFERIVRTAEGAHDFSVIRGRVPEKLIEAAAEADLIALGKASASRCSRRKLGRTARTVLQRAPVPVMVVREAPAAQAPVITYFDGSAAAERALGLAVTLTRRQPALPLTVLVPPEYAGKTERLRRIVASQRGTPPVPLRVRLLNRIEASQLATVVHAERGGLVVLPHSVPPLRGDNVQRFLYELDRPVLVVY